jgi:hypothetical protein
MNRFWERVMLVLVVCVPVPALALSGLNIPLPSVVERVAAALVPFARAATLDEGTTLAAGKIVRAPGHVATSTSDGKAARTSVTVRVRRTATKPQPRRVRVETARLAPSTLGPGSTIGEDTTVNVPESPASDPDTRSSTPPADTGTTPKPDDRVDPTLPVDVDGDVKLDPAVEVDVAPTPEPDVEPPKLDAPLDVDVPGEAPRDESALETALRGLGI